MATKVRWTSDRQTMIRALTDFGYPDPSQNPHVRARPTDNGLKNRSGAVAEAASFGPTRAAAATTHHPVSNPLFVGRAIRADAEIKPAYKHDAPASVSRKHTCLRCVLVSQNAGLISLPVLSLAPAPFLTETARGKASRRLRGGWKAAAARDRRAGRNR